MLAHTLYSCMLTRTDTCTHAHTHTLARAHTGGAQIRAVARKGQGRARCGVEGSTGGGGEVAPLFVDVLCLCGIHSDSDIHTQTHTCMLHTRAHTHSLSLSHTQTYRSLFKELLENSDSLAGYVHEMQVNMHTCDICATQVVSVIARMCGFSCVSISKTVYLDLYSHLCLLETPARTHGTHAHAHTHTRTVADGGDQLVLFRRHATARAVRTSRYGRLPKRGIKCRGRPVLPCLRRPNA